MKSLILVRHGKSSWEQTRLRDFERPLAPRGIRDAGKMARRLCRLDVRPDIIVTSPARRALATAEIFVEALGMETEDLQKEPRIYEADLSTLLGIVQELPDSWDSVMLVGHNPGFTSLACALAGNGPDNMPTSAYAVIRLEVDDWIMVREGSGQEILFDYPKNRDAL